MVLQYSFLRKLRHFLTLILFLYKGSGEEGQGTSLGYLTGMPCSASGNKLYLQSGATALSQFTQFQMSSSSLRLLQGSLLCSQPEKGTSHSRLLARLGQAFDLLLKMYELLQEAAAMLSTHCPQVIRQQH